jgi:hypothetical protein
LLSFSVFAAATATATEDFIQLHDSGERLPFDLQGPFVTTTDDGVLAVGSSHVYVSHDDGQSWKFHPRLCSMGWCFPEPISPTALADLRTNERRGFVPMFSDVHSLLAQRQFVDQRRYVSVM